MERKQLLELALETLEKQKAEIDSEIAEVQELLDGKPRVTARKREIPTLVVVKRRSKTLAERKAQAIRMKRYWAAKRAKKAKPVAQSKAIAASAKIRSMTVAQKKALSLKMKEAWKKRKAAAAQNAKTK
jgi:hypothetical protein